MMKKFRSLEIKECPFANLREANSGRWGALPVSYTHLTLPTILRV